MNQENLRELTQNGFHHEEVVAFVKKNQIQFSDYDFMTMCLRLCEPGEGKYFQPDDVKKLFACIGEYPVACVYYLKANDTFKLDEAYVKENYGQISQAIQILYDARVGFLPLLLERIPYKFEDSSVLSRLLVKSKPEAQMALLPLDEAAFLDKVDLYPEGVALYLKLHGRECSHKWVKTHYEKITTAIRYLLKREKFTYMTYLLQAVPYTFKDYKLLAECQCDVETQLEALRA